MRCRVTAGRAILTALAGMTAYEEGQYAGNLLAASGDDPGEAFTAALGLASTLAEEVRRLGGDPEAIRRRIYEKASDLAYT